MKLPAVVFLMGPTASGKTRLAMWLHQQLSCELISVDSAMVYRGMDIGTAKPTREMLQQAPHHLVDVVAPTGNYSAGCFYAEALALIEDCHRRRRLPVLVGGTGLYFHVLEHGLSRLPTARPAVRLAIGAEAARLGWPAMHERLAQVDAASAERISPNDAQRIQRALEVWQQTGVAMSRLWRRNKPQALKASIIRLVMQPSSRAELHQRVERRFDDMLRRGLTDELQDLRRRYALNETMPSMRLVGYRQVWQYLQGEISQEMMREKAVSATRQLARRQMTWLRAQPSADLWTISDDTPSAAVLDMISQVMRQ